MNPTKSEPAVSTETPTATRRDTLTITDNRNGQQYEVPIKNDTIRADRSAQDQDQRIRFRDDELRSVVREYGVLHQQDHLHRWRQGHPALPRLFDRRTGGKKHLSRDGLPDSLRRTSHESAAGGLDLPHHAPHVHPREHQEISGWLSLRRPSDGHADLDGGRAFHFLSRTRRISSTRNRGASRPTV